MSFDSYSSSIGGPGNAGGGGGDGGKVDQRVLMAAQQLKLQLEISERCRKLNGMCWDICDINPKDKLDGKQETCLSNCSERYMDTENYIKNRLMQKAQEAQSGGGFS